MKIDDALKGVTHIFLDTAPVIYFVENHPLYFPLVENIFNRFDSGNLLAATSPVTLAETLIMPLRLNLTHLQKAFTDVITNGSNTTCFPIDTKIGQQAANLRARYNLPLTDALQIAVALSAGCDAFLTNDLTLKRVVEIQIIVTDELEL